MRKPLAWLLLIPISLGVQFGWSDSNVVACGTFAGGYNCVTFPDGAVIERVSWESTLKVPGEVLIRFLLYDPATGALTSLPSTHHAHPGSLVRDYPGVTVPPGGVIGVVFDGVGAPHPAPVEVQATLWVRP